MPETIRTFVAVPIPEAQRRELARLQERLAGQARGMRPVKLEHFHMTLAFLGDVPRGRIEAIGAAADEAAAGAGAFTLELAGVGVFPDARRPRVVWAGLRGEGIAALERLQGALVAALARAGHRPAEDRFSPHVTIGRIKPGGPAGDLGAALARCADWSAPAFEVSEVRVHSSVLTPDGPTYGVLHRAALRG